MLRNLSLSTMLYMLSIGIIIPILPFFILDKGGGAQNAALAFSFFSGAAFFSAPLWGRFSDSIGRKPVLLMSAFITVVSYIWLLQAESIIAIFAARTLAGVGAGWFSVSRAFVADITSKQDRSKGMGYIGASIGVGFALGPAIGGWTVSFSQGAPNYRLAFILCIITVSCAALFSFIALKEPKKEKTFQKWMPFPVLHILRNTREIRRLFFLCFLVLVAFEGVGAIFAPWFDEILGLGAIHLAWILSFSGAISILSQASIHFLVKKWSEKALMRFSILSILIPIAFMSFNKSFAYVFPAIAFLAIGVSLYTTLTQSLISKRTDSRSQGSVLGGFQSLSSLARIIGPIWAGFVFVRVNPSMPFITSAILCSVALILFCRKDQESVQNP